MGATTKPALTVDTLVFAVAEGGLNVLLIERAQAPFRGRWALPGGFVEPAEPLEDAARRELVEETGLRVGDLWPVGAFGDPGRDPRGWTVSVVFYTLCGADRLDVRAADDARRAVLRPVDRPGRLAFDHRKILNTALERLRREIYFLPVARGVLPRPFQIGELHDVLGAVDPGVPSPGQLRRRCLDNRLIRLATPRGRYVFEATGK